jgi:hypothetical protein
LDVVEVGGVLFWIRYEGTIVETSVVHLDEPTPLIQRQLLYDVMWGRDGNLGSTRRGGNVGDELGGGGIDGAEACNGAGFAIGISVVCRVSWGEHRIVRSRDRETVEASRVVGHTSDIIPLPFVGGDMGFARTHRWENVVDLGV